MDDYHFAPDGTNDADRTLCGQSVGWLLMEAGPEPEHSTAHKDRFLADPDRCKACAAAAAPQAPGLPRDDRLGRSVKIF